MKHIPRFYLHSNFVENPFIIKDHKIVEKCYKVLRLTSSDFVDVITESWLYNCQIIKISKSEIILSTFNKSQLIPENQKFKITLAQALPKGQKLDEIFKVNTEIGISEFIIFESEYSQVKVKDITSNKIDRLKKIVTEAVQQSERRHFPSIKLLKNLEDVIKADNFDYIFILHSRKQNYSEEISNFKLKDKSKILVLIGPEGGFSDYEIDIARQSKVNVLYLNIPILRTENAGFAIAARLLI